MTVKAVGEEAFRWFIGVVEDRDDPEKQGRVRVRIYNVHGNAVEAPTNTLPWALILMPGFSSSLNQVGVSATGLQLNSTVVGFFMDGNEATMPLIIGALPGKNDLTRLAIGQNNINKERIGPEPESAYNAKYPFNKVTTTESGHVMEVDDTPNFERTHQYHRSGTYTEIDHDGRKVDKVVGDSFEIVVQNKTVYIRGNVNIKVDGKYTVESGGNMLFKAPRIDFNP